MTDVTAALHRSGKHCSNFEYSCSHQKLLTTSQVPQIWQHVQVIDMTFCLTALHAELLSLCIVDAYAKCYSNAGNALPCVMTNAKCTLRHTCSGATLLVPSIELSKWSRRLIAPAPWYRDVIASRVARPIMTVGTAMDLQHQTWCLRNANGHKWTHTPGLKHRMTLATK